ncbi:hypothetical protein V8F33_002476 [Rhypophila sp. PSN 637]
MSHFGFHTEGLELVQQFHDQVKGRTFLITGPSKGGIGAETAISLAHGHPSTLILLGRSLDRIQPTIDTILSIDSSITTKFVPIDLSSLSSVRSAASIILNDPTISHIDVIINNAAIMATPYSLTPDGIESQLGANHMGHFLLTNLLMPKLLLTSSPTAALPHRKRIINVSSVANLAGGIRFHDPNYTLHPEEYTPFNAYGQSKTAIILFTIALNNRIAGKAARSWSLNPGSIATSLGRTTTPEMRQDALTAVFGKGATEFPARKTLQQGCATTLRAALDPSLEDDKDPDAVYLNDCQVTTDPRWIDPRALDKASAEKLWTLSEELVGEKFVW